MNQGLYKNILVIQTAFIGDAILASSLLEKLHKSFPDSKISILVRNGNQSLYDNHPFLSEILVWYKKEKKIRNLFSLLKKIRSNRYDCVINCHRYSSSGFLTAFSGARHTSGYKENPFSFLFNFTARHIIGDGRHETERYNELVSDFCPGKPYKPALYPTDADYEHVKKFIKQPYVCIAPGSVWNTKQLPEAKWIELINQFPADRIIYLLGAGGDTELCERIRKGTIARNVVNLTGMLTFLQSCALMKQSLMNYVNDSAPLHFTSAMNAPVRAFFCSTVPEFGFGPLSDNSKIYGVSELPCRPCGLHGYKKCPLGHFNCGHLMPLPAAVE